MKWTHGMMVAAVLTAWTAAAENIEPTLHKGTHELTLQGFADLEKRDDYWYFADVGYGYFVIDGLELGINVVLEGSDDYDRISLGPFVEYNFLTKSRYVPFVGFGAQWINADLDIGSGDQLVSSSTDALLLDVEGGLKIFLSNNIAISTALAYEWATEDVFEAGNDADDGNALLKLGMRFYL